VEEGSRALPISAIVQKAAQTGSAGLILAQRPEGSDGLPSNRQAQNTRALADAAELIDVVVLDHLLISESGCESMRRSGLL
jgi:DNA repair protein RadC